MDGKTVAMEILKQLGGNRFLAMTGAKNLSYDIGTLNFQLPKLANGINAINIQVNSMDTYDVTFYKFSMRTANFSIVKEVDGIYNDQLQQIFTAETGLYCTL